MADAAILFAVEKLGDALIHKVKFLKGIEEQVRWLKDELESMQCFLKDAAVKQGQNESIRKWIRDVREAAQDAEDVIDIFTLKLTKPRKSRDIVRKWAGFPVDVSHLNRVGKEIKSIRTRLDEMAKRRERYGIRNLGEVGVESLSRSRSDMVELRRRMAARLQRDKDVVGLNEDADFLLKKVILDQGRERLSLAAIVGMGGIGKSTLARKIYNHPDVAARFEQRAWVVVSSEFAVEDIMKQIMHELSIPLDADELKTLGSIQGNLRLQEMLQEMLRKRLEGKRYFVVLDDMWEKTHWEALKAAFPDEQDKASRLVFTSRNQIITEHRGYIHKMKLLNPDDSWELLLKTSLIGRSEGRCSRELEEIGREILKKCDGLPLAITIAGGLLVSHGESESGWSRVLSQINNYHLETSEIGTNISSILELSYQNLPSDLKPCFLCLAFFKEDAIIKVKRLVHIWIVLGLIPAGEESVEEIARRNLDELINRNLVLVKDMSIDDTRVTYCHVHDLLLELSIRNAKEEIGFESLNSEDGGSSSSSSYKPRHRVVRGNTKRLIQVDSSNQNKHIRSLFLHVEGSDDVYDITPSYWKGFELLRILDIEASRLQEFPPKIRALIGLRYLRLREEGALRLPSWLDVLKNLEILDIAESGRVTFPDVTWRMDALRHFYINSRCDKFTNSMKKSSWKNLETLKYMRSDELLFNNPVQGFSHRLLRKLGVDLVDTEGEAEMGKLLSESDVQVLHLRWTTEWRPELPLLNSLDRLTKLKLHGSMNSCPPADRFPQNITHLTLTQSLVMRSDHDAMQELGKLPKLLFLKLDFVTLDIESIKVSSEGFPRLKVLILTRMYGLKCIEIEEGGMPHLQRLQIHKCLQLQNIDNLRERIRPAQVIINAD